ncbi:MAG: hypothetical protein KC684_07665 [Candidatus Omnitrophica bacterium]|nr:hypothetical protein [Candidatus Omnitrophota bacterium]
MIFIISLTVCYIINVLLGTPLQHKIIILGWTLAALNYIIGQLLKNKGLGQEDIKFLTYAFGLNFLKLLFILCVTAVILRKTSIDPFIFISSLMASYGIFLIEEIRKLYGVKRRI